MAIDLSQFYQVFFEESKEHLQAFEQLLLNMNVKNPDDNQLNAIFRAAHSIKGGSATFGFSDITAVTHELESLLDKLRKKELVLQTEMIDVCLQTADVIKAQLQGHVDGQPANASIADAVSKKLMLLNGQAVSQNNNASNTKLDDGFGFFDDAVATENKTNQDDDFGLFEPLAIANKLKINKPAKPEKIAENRRAAKAMDRRSSDRRATDGIAENSSIRVDVGKVDQLINLIGELVITEAMLMQSLSDLPANILENMSISISQLTRNTRDLQEAVMSVRMMPISNLFVRFPRLVRDLAGQLKKEVQLITLGEETELDKVLIEKIADPLTHLIRNSLDHGIESPKQRKALGKPEGGTIILSAMHQGGNIMIEVADDGAGLNSALIIEKAKQRGIAIPSSITDDSLWEIICQPGFSTAKNVTDISGRGVGMDVVNRNITEMGGQIQVMSNAGKGCTFSIQLPLTLAIVDGMIVSLGENLYVIPLNAIIETIQPQLDQLKSMTGGGNMVLTRDEYIPIIAMHLAFNTPTQITDLCKGMLVIVESHGKKAALFLDDLVGQQQVVIKNLETNFRKVNGISAATILGSGKVALIIDVPAMIKIGQNISAQTKTPVAASLHAAHGY